MSAEDEEKGRRRERVALLLGASFFRLHPHFRMLIHSGSAAPAALTGGFQWAFWVCGAIGVAAVPITFLLVRSRDLVQTADPQPALVEREAA